MAAISTFVRIVKSEAGWKTNDLCDTINIWDAEVTNTYGRAYERLCDEVRKSFPHQAKYLEQNGYAENFYSYHDDVEAKFEVDIPASRSIDGMDCKHIFEAHHDKFGRYSPEYMFIAVHVTGDGNVEVLETKPIAHLIAGYSYALHFITDYMGIENFPTELKVSLGNAIVNAWFTHEDYKGEAVVWETSAKEEYGAYNVFKIVPLTNTL